MKRHMEVDRHWGSRLEGGESHVPEFAEKEGSSARDLRSEPSAWQRPFPPPLNGARALASASQEVNTQRPLIDRMESPASISKSP